MIANSFQFEKQTVNSHNIDLHRVYFFSQFVCIFHIWLPYTLSLPRAQECAFRSKNRQFALTSYSFSADAKQQFKLAFNGAFIEKHVLSRTATERNHKNISNYVQFSFMQTRKTLPLNELFEFRNVFEMQCRK